MTRGVRIEPTPGEISIRVLRDPIPRSAEQRAAIDEAWREMCARNPRYFNGRVLSFEGFDPGMGAAVARDEEYAAHAARKTVDLGISYFGITGILRTIDRARTRRYLVARRSRAVHEYPGLWEFAPCGGIDPPPPSRDRLSSKDVAGELVREAREELGIDLGDATQRPLALVHDDPVGSTDLMVLVDLPAVPETDGNWEYSDSRWASLQELIAWDGHASLIPTTAAMAGWLARSPHA